MKKKWFKRIEDGIGYVVLVVGIDGVIFIVYSLADRFWSWTAPR